MWLGGSLIPTGAYERQSEVCLSYFNDNVIAVDRRHHAILCSIAGIPVQTAAENPVFLAFAHYPSRSKFHAFEASFPGVLPAPFSGSTSTYLSGVSCLAYLHNFRALLNLLLDLVKLSLLFGCPPWSGIYRKRTLRVLGR